MALTASLSAVTAADGTFSVAGATAWNALTGLPVTLSGIASPAQGGTGIAYFTAAGPSVARVYTFPDAAATILYSGGPLGTPSSGTLTSATGLPEGGLSLTDLTTNDFSTARHGFVPKGTNVGSFLKDDGTWAAPTAASTLNGITAATGAVTIASGNNTGIVWNWANTTDATACHTLGETSPATNGTLTAGIPNQVLLKLTTLAGSTMSPLSVYALGVPVFSVNPSASLPQILGANGQSLGPMYSFAGATTTGMYRAGASLVFTTAATDRLTLGTTAVFSVAIRGIAGSGTVPAVADPTNATGIFWPSATTVGIANSTFGELARFTGGTNTALFGLSAMLFANLGTPADGNMCYCSDCDAPTLVDSTCTSVGTKTGSFAARVNNLWKCFS